jgi:DNA-binding MarR family transcriptional regulator
MTDNHEKKQIFDNGTERLPANSLMPLWRTVNHAFLNRIQKWELLPHAVMVLLHLRVNPDNGEPALLAESTCFPRQTITNALDTLETKKLARRVPHPHDRRRKRVILTTAGDKLSAAMLDDLIEFETTALAVIPADEVSRWREFMNNYVEALVSQNGTATVSK